LAAVGMYENMFAGREDIDDRGFYDYQDGDL
jgi:hypothetical protein